MIHNIFYLTFHNISLNALKNNILPAIDNNIFLRAPKAVTPISRRSLSVNVLKVVQSIS